MPLLQLERLTFRFVEVGFACCRPRCCWAAFTTTQWRWDHKTVLLAAGLGVFAALLVGPPPARLARPPRHALAVRGRGAAAAGLRGSRFVFEVLLAAGRVSA
jgi:hypothetical protein